VWETSCCSCHRWLLNVAENRCCSTSVATTDAPCPLAQQENVGHNGNHGESRGGDHHPPTDGPIVSRAAREPRGPALFEAPSSFCNLSHARREILGRNG